MADNTNLPVASSNGDDIRTKDRTTYKTPVSLIDVGGTSAEALIGDAGIAMPVKGLGTAGTPDTGVVSIQGVASGTAVPVSQSGTFTVTGAGGTFPVTGTFWQATQPVSLASVPSHPVTNAGTFAVQETGTLLTQVVDFATAFGDCVGAADNESYTSGQGTVISGAVRKDSASALATADGLFSPLQVDASGQLRITLPSTTKGSAGSAATEVLTVQGIASMTPLTVTGASGTFPVTDSGGSLTVDNAGTFAVQAAQSGTWTVQPGNTANTTAWLVTGTGGTFPVTDSGGSLTVDNGGTFAVQAAQSGTWTVTGAGGTFPVTDNSGSLTVDAPANSPVFVQLSDGASALGTLPVSLASGRVASGAFASGSVSSGAFASGSIASGAIAAGAIADLIVDDAAFTPATTRVFMSGFTFDDVSPDSVNEGDGGAARMSANRNIYMTIRDAAGNERGVNVNASNQLAVAGPVTAVSGAFASGAFASGAFASGSVASGAIASGAIATGAIADMLVDDAAFTPATSRVMPMGCQADETATDSVDEGDVGCPRMTLDRKQLVTLQPHTAGGCDYFNNLDVDETEDDIKTSAGQLYELYLFNTTTSIIYVKLYNATAANVTVGSTTPVMTIPVPGNNDSDGGGVVRNWPTGLKFDTAICIAATTGVANADTGAPATNAIIASGAYK